MDVLHPAKPRVVRTWGICVIYSELCTTSNFTFLRGASHPEELVTRAADLGLSAIAITDHNSLAGVVRAHAALKELRRNIDEITIRSTKRVDPSSREEIPKKRREEGGFNGYEKIKKDLENGSEKIRVGIRPEGKIIARENTKIFSKEGEEIGIITSGTFGPSVNSPVAMGYVKTKFSEIDTNLLLEVRGNKYAANVAKLPFYKKSYVK